MDETEQRNALAGCLMGGAIGDALGLPFEGLSPRRRAALFGDVTAGYRFIGNRGMVSDDTEHAVLTARALCESSGNPERFAASLARQLRGWIVLLPAGVGLATLRACGRLLLGVPPDKSGVFSAGNGPAMRAAIIGVAWGHNAERTCRLVRASSRLTHSDPKAEWGAVLVAAGAYAAATNDPASLDAALSSLPPEANELVALVEQARKSAAEGASTEVFARSVGVGLNGVSGYIYQTVPVALQAAWRFPDDLEAALQAAISCGGDTDTIAAITGGVVGANIGRTATPPHLVEGLCEWPQTVGWLDDVAYQLARSLETNRPQPAPPVNVLGRLPRNLVFLLVVLAHGLRRLLPPY